jgi:uncharacterized protein with HEPN domain
MKEKEKAYSIFLDAISYRLEVLGENINQKYLPEEVVRDYKDKIDYLLKLRDVFF